MYQGFEEKVSMKRISVMIVDDEKLVIEDLKTLVDWEMLGFEIVATAFNGRQALEKYRIHRPQVVFTDVKMPFMDGLEFIRLLRESDNETCIFLLTAYEDFTYARTAIKYGVKDYVIKSKLDEQTFSELLKELFRDIRQQNQFQDMLMEKQIVEYLEAPAGNCEKDLQPMNQKAYTYILVEQDMPIAFADEAVPPSYICSKKEILTAVVLDNSVGCEAAAVSYIPEQKILVVLDISEISQLRVMEITHDYARKVRQRLKNLSAFSFTVYVIDRKVTFKELRQIYRQGETIFQKKYWLGCGGIIAMQGAKEAAVEAEEVVADIVRLQEMIDRRDTDKAVEYVQEIFANLEMAQNVKWLRMVSRELYTLLKKNYKQIPGQRKQNLDMTSNFQNWLDIYHLKNWFAEQFYILIRAKEQVYSKVYSRPIVLAIEYIFKHYQEHNLTIKDIAEKVYLSTGHLCGMFKRETGKTLNNYITEIRIEEAKKLLEEGELKIYEVSSAVGYQSSQYFSQIFYKMTGTFPTNWQKDSRRM